MLTLPNDVSRVGRTATQVRILLVLHEYYHWQGEPSFLSAAAIARESCARLDRVERGLRKLLERGLVAHRDGFYKLAQHTHLRRSGPRYMRELAEIGY